MTVPTPDSAASNRAPPAVRGSSWRLGAARVCLSLTALAAAFLLYYLPLPGTSSRPGALRTWVLLAGIIVLASVLQWGIGRRRRLARQGAVFAGLTFGALTLWSVIRFWLAWDGTNLGPAAVLSYVLALMALAGFPVAAACCAAAPTERYGWH